MASKEIGRVTAPSGKTYEVRYDASSKDVYIQYRGTLTDGPSTNIGRAASAQEAMIKAEAAVYNK